jgi:hypothetical protein
MWTLIDLKASYDITNSYFTMLMHHIIHKVDLESMHKPQICKKVKLKICMDAPCYTVAQPLRVKLTYMNAVLVAVTSR